MQHQPRVRDLGHRVSHANLILLASRSGDSARMFDFAWTEIVLIGVVALIAIGPKDLPAAIKTVAGMVKKARRMAGEFQTHVDDMVREADLHEVRAQFNDLKNFNIGAEIEKAVDSDGSLRATFNENPMYPTPVPPTTVPPATVQPSNAPDSTPQPVIEAVAHPDLTQLPIVVPPAFIPPVLSAFTPPAPPAFIPPGIPPGTHQAG